MICRSCLTDNPDAAKFCFNCGTKVAAEAPAPTAPVCRECQAPLPPEARFCGMCGTRDPLAAPAQTAVPADLGVPAQPLAPVPAQPTAPAEPASPAASVNPGLVTALAYDDDRDDDVLRRVAPGPSSVAARRSPLGAKAGLGRPEESAGSYVKHGPSLRARREGNPDQRATPVAEAPAASAPMPEPAPMGMPEPARAPESVGMPESVEAPHSPAESMPAAAPPMGASPLLEPPPEPATPVSGGTMPPVDQPRRKTEPPSGMSAVVQELQSMGGDAAMTARTRGGRSKPRPVTQPQQAVFASPRPEMAAILAAPDGWPDITDELAEIRFSSIQGFDDDTRKAVEALRERYPGHPEVDILVAELGGDPAEASTDPEASEDRAAAFEAPSDPAAPGVPEPAFEEPMAAPGVPHPVVDAAPQSPAEVPESLPRRTILPQSADGRDPPVVAVEPIEDDALETIPFDSVEGLDSDAVDEASEVSDAALPLESLEVELLDPTEVEVEEVEDVEEIEDVTELSDDELSDDELSLDAEPGPLPGIEDEPEFLERTMSVQGYQPPAPFRGTAAGGANRIAPDPEPEFHRDLGGAGDGPSVQMVFDGRDRSTLAPGEYRTPDELHETLAPGAQEGATLAPIEEFDVDPEPSVVTDPSVTIIPDEPGQAPSPTPYGTMTTPDSESEAAASGEFRVVDLDLPEGELNFDDLEDLDHSIDPEPVEVETSAITGAVYEAQPDALTAEGTVVARAPLPPAPFGQAEAQVPVVAVRLVMLGARGQPVAERRIEPATHFDIGRTRGEPWAEDSRMEVLHARLFPAPGGVVVDDFGGVNGVHSQIFDTIAVQDGDEFKVGQARLKLRRLYEGPAWGELVVVRHDRRAPEVFALTRDVISVGRDEGDITLPNDTFVSGDHCRFVREGNAIYLEDRGSSNGTYVRMRAGQCIAFGGLLLVGHTQFKIHPG